MKSDRRPRKAIGAAVAVGLTAIVAALIAGRVILLKFFPGSLLLPWIAGLGN